MRARGRGGTARPQKHTALLSLALLDPQRKKSQSRRPCLPLLPKESPVALLRITRTIENPDFIDYLQVLSAHLSPANKSTAASTPRVGSPAPAFLRKTACIPALHRLRSSAVLPLPPTSRCVPSRPYRSGRSESEGVRTMSLVERARSRPNHARPGQYGALQTHFTESVSILRRTRSRASN